MEKVIPESDELLNVNRVIEYLEAVAPIPFANKFIYRSKITEYCNERGIKIDEYTVQVNGNQLFKPYGTKIYDGSIDQKKVVDEIKDVEFHEFVSSEGKILAWMWFGVSKFEQQIKPINRMRGIRLRKENIQIGDENTLGASPKFFKEARGNCYFVGEVYVIDNKLIPNARRDYFKIDSTLKELEELLRQYFSNDLHKLYHYANQVKKAFESQIKYNEIANEYSRKVSEAGFVNDKDQTNAIKDLENAKERAEKGKHTLELRKQDADENSMFNRVYTQLEQSFTPVSEKINCVDKANANKSKEEKKYLTQNLSKYSKKEQKLISKIYDIIKSILPREMADMVVAKIQEELSK